MKSRFPAALIPGTIRQWHWISSAVCLAGMLLFAITGITLNHAGRIEASPELTTIEMLVPDELLSSALAFHDEDADLVEAPLPADLRAWLMEQGIVVGGRDAEWSNGEIYLSMPRPGGDAWMSLDLFSADLIYEDTDRGWISYLNDLHKGRNAGVVWARFIDVFSIASIVFCITGLLLMIRHSRSRPASWPVTGLGVLIPVLIALLFIH